MTTHVEPETESSKEVARSALRPPLETTVIAPRSGWQPLDLKELWKHRDLLYFLAWRDVKVKYKQTVLGVLWVVLQPLLMMMVLMFVFGRFGEKLTGDVAPPIFYFSGLIPWFFFASSITNASESVVASEAIVSKVYFPRLAIPLSAVAASLFDFAIGLSALLLLMIPFELFPSLSILWIPVVILLMLFAAFGVGTLIAALNVAYRDFRYVTRFLVQLWIFATPSVYLPPELYVPLETGETAVAAEATEESGATEDTRRNEDKEAAESAASGADAVSDQSGDSPSVPSVSKSWNLIYLNPMTGLIEFFRSALLGLPIRWIPLLQSSLVAVVLLAVGLIYFRRVEDTFADII